VVAVVTRTRAPARNRARERTWGGRVEDEEGEEGSTCFSKLLRTAIRKASLAIRNTKACACGGQDNSDTGAEQGIFWKRRWSALHDLIFMESFLLSTVCCTLRTLFHSSVDGL